MPSPTTVDAGVLRSCSAAEDPSGELATDLARLHHQIRVEVARQLGAVVCAGWEVSAACAWSLVEPDGLLCPDVVVHRTPDRRGRLPAPPDLCVVVGTGPPDRRSANAYARAGVDHHWYLDSRDGVVEVSVRVGDEYRRAETVTTGDVGEWIDFGVGIVRLTAVVRPACPRAAPEGR